MYPISPAQAAILGQQQAPQRRAPPPVATVGGMPISPAQAAALGMAPQQVPQQAQTGQTQIPQQQLAGQQSFGGFQPNPMADLLIDRANRPGDIRTGAGLLGRLAALGVGTKLKKDNIGGAQESALELVETLPPEQQALARLAVLTGKPEAIFQMAAQNAALEVQKRGQDVSSSTTVRGQDKTVEVAAADRAQRAESLAFDRAKFDDTLSLQRDNLTESIRSNQASESLAADRLEFDASKADADRAIETLKNSGIDLSESEGKALSMASQMAPSMEILEKDFKAYDPPAEVIAFVNDLVGNSGDMVSVIKSAIKGQVYAKFSDHDKRFLSHGLTVAEMMARDITGATVNAGEVATMFVRAFPGMGDPPQLRAEKEAIRRSAYEAMLKKIPAAAREALMGGV